jgi:hypothetical protein
MADSVDGRVKLVEGARDRPIQKPRSGIYTAGIGQNGNKNLFGD